MAAVEFTAEELRLVAMLVNTGQVQARVDVVNGEELPSITTPVGFANMPQQMFFVGLEEIKTLLSTLLEWYSGSVTAG